MIVHTSLKFYVVPVYVLEVCAQPSREDNPSPADVRVMTPDPKPRKVSLVQWLLTQHSLIGLCFSRNGPPPIPIPGCCCVCVDDLPIRERAFVLAFLLIASLCVSVEMTLGTHDEHWQWMALVVVVMPSTCFVKSIIRKLSSLFRRRFPLVEVKLRLRVEEILMVTWLLFYLGWAYSRSSDTDEVPKAVSMFLQALLVLWAAEFGTLLWKFFFCRACCCCCVPTEDDVAMPYTRETEAAETPVVDVRHAV